jgi:hypothetical protein
LTWSGAGFRFDPCRATTSCGWPGRRVPSQG